MRQSTPTYRSSLPTAPIMREIGGWIVADRFRDMDRELLQARHAVAVVDATPWGKITVEGEHARSAIETAFDVSAPAVGRGCPAPNTAVYRLRDDHFLLHTSPGAQARIKGALSAAIPSARHITVTDVTHGRAEIRVIGPHAEALMARVCGLDFHVRSFPQPGVKQTSVAKTAQIVVRSESGGLPTFAVIGARSMGRYLWETLIGAAREWGDARIGSSALLELQSTSVAEAIA